MRHALLHAIMFCTDAWIGQPRCTILGLVVPVAAYLRSTDDPETGAHCLIARVSNAGIASGEGDRAQHIGLHLGTVVVAPDSVEHMPDIAVAVISVDQGDPHARGIGICLRLHEGGIQRIRHVSTVAVTWRVADSHSAPTKE